MHLGYSPFVFQVGFSDRVRPEKNCSGINIDPVRNKRTERREKIKSENIALPEDFDVPKSILFKTTHTIAEVWLDGEKYMNMEMKRMLRVYEDTWKLLAYCGYSRRQFR